MSQDQDKTTKKFDDDLKERKRAEDIEKLRIDSGILLGITRNFFRKSEQTESEKKRDRQKKDRNKDANGDLVPNRRVPINPQEPKEQSEFSRKLGNFTRVVGKMSHDILVGSADAENWFENNQDLIKPKPKANDEDDEVEDTKPTKSKPKATPVKNDSEPTPTPTSSDSKAPEVTISSDDKSHIDTRKHTEDVAEGNRAHLDKAIDRLIDNNDKNLKKSMLNETRLRRRNKDWSPDSDSDVPTAKAVGGSDAKANVDSENSESSSDSSGGGGILDFAKKIPKKGLVAGAIVGGGVVAVTSVNKAMENGAFGGSSREYSLFDMADNMFGDGTRNLQRALTNLIKKMVDDGQSSFKSFNNAKDPWKGISKGRMRQLRMEQQGILQEYLRLWLNEKKLSATSSVMNSHKDAKKLGADIGKDSKDAWMSAISDRKWYFDKHIVSTDAKSTEEYTLDGAKKSQEEDRKRAEKVASQSSSTKTTKAKSKATSPKTNNSSATKTSKGGKGVNGSGANVPMANIDTSVDTLEVGVGSGVPYDSRGNTATRSGGLRVINNPSQEIQSVNKANSKESLDSLKGFLLKEFAPAVANAIINAGERAEKRQPKQSNSVTMGSPNILG